MLDTVYTCARLSHVATITSNGCVKQTMKTKQEHIEQLQREIELLKEAMKDTENPFMEVTYREAMDDKEQEIMRLMDEQEITNKYPEGDSHIDMSGASDNGDR